MNQSDRLAHSCVSLNVVAAHCRHLTPHVSMWEHMHWGQVPLVGRGQNIFEPKWQEFPRVVGVIADHTHLPHVLGPLADDGLVSALLLVHLVLSPLLITRLWREERVCRVIQVFTF